MKKLRKEYRNQLDEVLRKSGSLVNLGNAKNEINNKHF
jgi:hypothetical protein